jgi:tRNA (guanine-N7-)-methyltransferase
MILVRPEKMPGQWQTRFAQEQPLYLEVGSGKGQFIVAMAQAHPEYNFIALELQEAAIAMILKKQVALKLPNLQLVLGDGADLKRRLTYHDFLRQYQAIMKPNALLQFKTDNQGLFEYSLVSMNNFGMTFDLVSLDLHHDKRVTDNVPTEYEEKFSADGGRIYELVAHF